jgi:hypothetical protein
MFGVSLFYYISSMFGLPNTVVSCYKAALSAIKKWLYKKGGLLRGTI